MRDNRRDGTLERNYVETWRHRIREYEQVKAGRHPRFRFVQDFYRAYGVNRQTFIKYYHRYQAEGAGGLLPAKRGPKWKSRRTPEEIEALVVEERRLGANRYEIFAVLQPRLGERTPAPSTIYAISRRHGLGRRRPAMKQEKRRIVTTRAGELGHLDAHYLPKDLVLEARQRLYLVAVVDACTRLAWAEVTTDLKSLSVMFAALKGLNLLHAQYGVTFEALLTDNGAEMASRTNPAGHPMERLLRELGIQHRYTRPYRPQTNGKVERFWRTLQEELLDFTTFETIAALRAELTQYLLYYNTRRPHQALAGKPPATFMHQLTAGPNRQRIT